MGKKATMINSGGEGSPRWQLVEDKGNHEDDLTVDSKPAVKDLLLPGDTALPPMGMGDEEPSHMTKLARLLAQPQATKCDRASRVRTLRGLHDGHSFVLDGKENLLGPENGSHPG